MLLEVFYKMKPMGTQMTKEQRKIYLFLLVCGRTEDALNYREKCGLQNSTNTQKENSNEGVIK